MESRSHVQGGIYYLVLHNKDDTPLFFHSADYRAFTTLVMRCAKRFRCTVVAFAWMPTTAHLLLQVRHVSAHHFARRVTDAYTVKLPRRYAHPYHVITHYRCMRVDELMKREALIELVHSRPVKAGLCVTANEWPWNGPLKARRQRIAAAATGPRERRLLQRRRSRAVKLLAMGLTTAEVADRLRVSVRSVQLWAQKFRRGGRRALRLRSTDTLSMVNGDQRRTLLRLLRQPPAAAGLAADRWTYALVGQLIERRWSVIYSRSGVWRLLRRLRVDLRAQR